MESKRFRHISCTKYIFRFSSKMIALHQNVANCQNTLTVITQRWSTTQDNFILPAPPKRFHHISSTKYIFRFSSKIMFLTKAVPRSRHRLDTAAVTRRGPPHRPPPAGAGGRAASGGCPSANRSSIFTSFRTRNA